MHKFAYFGTPYVARDTLAALAAGSYIPAVVVTAPDAPQGRGLIIAPCDTKEWAQTHGIPVLTPTMLDASFLDELATFGCEYGIAVAYGKILPEGVINAFPKGMLNVHYSLLPKYRGASPVERALWNDDHITGVTIQQMAFELDAGDIIAQREVAIEPDDTTLTLRPRLITQGAELLIETLPSFINGTSTHTLQDPEQVTRARKIKKEEGRLSLKDDAKKNWLTYRALRESPGTFFIAEKWRSIMRVKITEAHFENAAFVIDRIIPEGKSEQPFSYLDQNGWDPQ